MPTPYPLTLITPTKKVYSDDVDMVILRTQSGDLGVLNGHENLITSLGYGVMRIFKDGEESVFSVLGGVAKIDQSGITILSDAAERPDEIDKARLQEAKERAERIIKEQTSDLEVKKAELALRRAFVRIEASSYPLISSRK